MDEYGPSTYGDRIADAYDEWVRLPTDAEEAAAFLAELAGPGPALELGIGTGRVALPLAARGVEIHGIDVSEAMVAKLRAKPGGADVPVTMGDFADLPVEGVYRLIFVIFNTFFGLLTQDDQLRCLSNVAAHLAEGGVFAMQAFVPDVTRFDRGQRVETGLVEPNRVMFDVARHDPVHQRVDSQHVLIEGNSIRMYPVRIRYAWPSELDLMARLARLRLRERWAGWKREPFDASSGQHISVYEPEPRG